MKLIKNLCDEKQRTGIENHDDYQMSLKLLTNLFQNSYGCRQVVKVFRVYFYRKSRDDASLTTHKAGTLC